LTRSSERRFVARLAGLLQATGRGVVTDDPELYGEIQGQCARAACMVSFPSSMWLATLSLRGHWAQTLMSNFLLHRELLVAPNLTATQKSEALELVTNALLTELAQSQETRNP
jgi:hypothetical protein